MLKFSHLHFPVSDLSRSVRWYAEMLGWKVTLQVDAIMAAFEVGLVLDQGAPGTGPAGWKEAVASGSSPERTAATIAVEGEDVEKVYQMLMERGANVETPPQDRPWGARNLYIRDPDGYVIEFTQPIGDRVVESVKGAIDGAP